MGGIPIIKLLFSLQDTAAIGGEMQGWEWHSEGDGLLQCGLETGEKYDRKKGLRSVLKTPLHHTHTYTCTYGSSKFAQEPLPVAV